jgi:Ser-tRNA(Ala) deacylase AlaX
LTRLFDDALSSLPIGAFERNGEQKTKEQTEKNRENISAIFPKKQVKNLPEQQWAATIFRHYRSDVKQTKLVGHMGSNAFETVYHKNMNE